jgi:hypothetical protein
MAAKVWLSVGSNHSALATPAFRLSQTIAFVTPPKKVSARHWPSIQSGSFWLKLAWAKVKDDAPSTATKI